MKIFRMKLGHISNQKIGSNLKAMWLVCSIFRRSNRFNEQINDSNRNRDKISAFFGLIIVIGMYINWLYRLLEAPLLWYLLRAVLKKVLRKILPGTK